MDEWIKKIFKKYSWWSIGLGAIIVTFVYALSLPMILKWVTSWSCFENCTIFHITSEIEDWFAFYGSFSGVFVSIVLTLITLRFTLKIEADNKESTLRKDEASLIMNIPYLNCKYVELYSINKRDVLQEYVDIKSSEGDFKMYFQLGATFPTYFQVEILELAFILDFGDEKVLSYQKDIDASKYVLRSNDDLRVYMCPPKFFEEVLERIYNLNFTNPLDGIEGDYLCEMKVTFKLINKIYKDSEIKSNEPINVQLIFTLQNEMYDTTRTCIRLNVINVQMKRVE